MLLRSSRVFALFTSLLLSVAPAVPASVRTSATGAAGDFVCGTGPVRERDALARARYASSLRQGASGSRALATCARSHSADSGDVAILEDDGTVFTPVNPFDLAGRAIRFEPAGARGYRIVPPSSDPDMPDGSEIRLADDDSQPILLAWTFTFYGIAYDTVFVNSDGNITLGGSDTGSEPRDAGRFLARPPRIAPLFADLDPSAGGSVLVRATADSLTVVWRGVPVRESTDTNTFSVRIFENGAVEFFYAPEMGARDAIVGLSPGSGGDPVNAVHYSAPREAGYLTGSIIEIFASQPTISESALAQLFLRTHPDDFDHLIVFLGFGHSLGSGYAYEVNVGNEVEGIGLGLFDNSALFGSRGRLRSFVMMGSLDGPGRYPPDPRSVYLGTNSTITILAHEVGHRWLAFAGFRNGDAISTSILGRQNAHWSFFLNSDGSVMGGNKIEERTPPGGERHFVTTGATRTYSALDQYLMGLLPTQQVPPMLLVENPTGTSRTSESAPAIGVTFGGSPRNVTIAQIVGGNGRRIPSVLQSSKVIRQAFVLLVRHGQEASSNQIAKVQRIRDEWVAFANEQTSGRAWIVTDLARTPGTTARDFIFPRIVENGPCYTGIALANWGATPADVTISSAANDGRPLPNGPAAANPRVITLPPGSQTTFAISTLYDVGGERPLQGWLRAASTSSSVAAFFAEGSVDGRIFGGAAAATLPSETLYFTAPLWTGEGPAAVPGLIDVVNPGGDSVELEFSLYDGAGVRRAVANRALLAGGRLSESTRTLFPDFAPAFSSAYVRLRSTSGVVGHQSSGPSVPGEAMPARPAPDGRKLFAPQFASGAFGMARYATELTLVNASESERTVTLQLRDDGGNLVGGLAGNLTLWLGPGALLRAPGDRLFGLPDPSLAVTGVEGSVSIASDGPGILGSIRFSNPVRHSSTAAIPLDSTAARQLVVPKILHGTAGPRRYFTGLALQNPASAAAEVTVELLDESGTVAASSRFLLAPYARTSGTLAQLIPALGGEARGYVRISSSGGPLAACALIGDQELDFLCPVPVEPVLESGPTSR